LAPFDQDFSEEKIFLTLDNQKQELPLGAIFVGGMGQNEETLLKKSSPLKNLGQMEPNLAVSIYVRFAIQLLHLVPFGQQTWPLLRKIARFW
jgi:hypothetical protein